MQLFKQNYLPNNKDLLSVIVLEICVGVISFGVILLTGYFYDVFHKKRD
jgi:hypothetical protein